MTFRKIAVVGLSVLLLALVGGALSVYFGLDEVVRRAVVSRLADSTGVDVSLGGVHIDLRAQSGSMRDLRIGNPPEFRSSEPLFSCSEISVGLDAATLKSKLVKLNTVRLEGVRVGFVGGKNGSNLQALAKRVEERSGAGEEEKKGDRRIYVGLLEIVDARLRLDLPGVSQHVELPLGNFSFREIGGSQGAEPGEIAEVVSKALADRAQSVVLKALPQTAVELGLAPEKLAEMLGLPVPEPLQKAADFLRGIFQR